MNGHGRRWWTFLPLAALGAGMSGLAWAQGPGAPAVAQAPGVPAGAGSAVPTVTRLVKLFGGLETELATAVRDRDRAAQERLLAEDFELRDASKPGLPTPRAAWLEAAATYALRSFRIEQMAARDLGGPVLVSFACEEQAAGGAEGGTRYFVVDVWTRQGSDWRLQVRHVGPADGPAHPTATGTGLEKKY